MWGFFVFMEMTTVYILFSEKLDRFYIGSTLDFEVRMDFHNETSGNKFTGKVRDWQVYFKIECEDKPQALKIESHIKKMKSKIYIQNLKKYPEISEGLLKKFQNIRG